MTRWFTSVSISQLEAEWKKDWHVKQLSTLTISLERKHNQNLNKIINCLEAFTVDNAGASLIKLLLGNPHFLEGGERCQDGATNPDGVFTLRWGNDLDLHGGRSQCGDLLLHTISDTRVHGGATRQDGVGIEILKMGTKGLNACTNHAKWDMKINLHSCRVTQCICSRFSKKVTKISCCDLRYQTMQATTYCNDFICLPCGDQCQTWRWSWSIPRGYQQPPYLSKNENDLVT